AESERQRLPNAAERNNTKAVRLMLEAGWPVNTPGEAGATALHFAGFHGNAEMTREILRFRPDLELKSRDYAGTALSWAIYGSGKGWHRKTGDYVGTVKALLVAGAVMPADPEKLKPSDAVLQVLRMRERR
ncbi:MAG: ankyrin repeat domain-containing protein, partial [Acidobacteriaceae bacterium]|nr:ankyrin repeat domain-containing protein [Acidobacteriaceae bacterium]